MNIEEKNIDEIKCGIIMPISAIDGCSPEHWLEVKSIFLEATSNISNYNFQTAIVSEAEESGIIQKRIVQNIYNSDIVICDVSGKNPNVMFELGMRLAFDKPTVIVKDDKTNYTFDTSIIEHLEYPRDLRFHKIIKFQEQLKGKLIATLKESIENPDHSTFLKSFGQFKVATLSEHEVTADKAILQNIEELRNDVYMLRKDYRLKQDKSVKYPLEARIKTTMVIDDSFKELNANSLYDVVNEIDLYDRVKNSIEPNRYFDSEDEFKIFYNWMLESYEEKSKNKDIYKRYICE